MKRANRKPFRFGVGTLYFGISKISSVGCITVFIMLGGIWATMLSHEQFTLGLRHEPIKSLIPGAKLTEKDDEVYQEHRYLLKGVDDGAVWHRALPIPTAHWLVNRTDAITVMGLHGTTAPATKEYVTQWVKENYPEADADEVYAKVFDRGISSWVRSWEIDPNNYWREDVALANFFRFMIWAAFGAMQSTIWRAGHREFLGNEFEKSNRIRRKVASKGSIGSTKVWEVMFNYVDMFYIALLLTAFVGSYFVEFTLTGGLSPKLQPRWLFRVLSVTGFEATLFVVTKILGLDDDKPKALPDKEAPTKQPTKQPTKTPPANQKPPKSSPKPASHKTNKPTWMPDAKTANTPPKKDEQSKNQSKRTGKQPNKDAGSTK